jgi:hypothetical protein
MGRFTDVTVEPDGSVRSRRTHDTAGWPAESLALLDQVAPLVRAAEWVGPLESVLDVPGVVPWLSWRAEDGDASFVCQTSDGLPVTYSVLVSGGGRRGADLLEALPRLPTGPGGNRYSTAPVPGAGPLADVTTRPLLATRMAGWPVKRELILASAQVETLLAAAFFASLTGPLGTIG